jgi:hypothetical protein
MCSKDRWQGVKVDHNVCLYKLKDFWIPNAAMKQWHLDFWRPWQDLQLRQSYEIKPPTTMPRMTGIVTLNINDLVSKKLELLNFLTGARVGIMAIQETLPDINKYVLRVLGYQIYQQQKRNGWCY